MMNLIPKILLAWGGAVLGLLYLAGAVVWVADATKHGVGPMVIAIAIASAVPAIVLVIVIQEFIDNRKVRK